MSPATALQDQLTHTPWPPSAPHVISLLDTTRRFKPQILEQRIAAQVSHASSHRIVLLDLREDRKPLNGEKLLEALQKHPYAMLAPLRVSWFQAERGASTGPRLRDALRGGKRRSPGWLIVSPDRTPSAFISTLASRERIATSLNGFRPRQDYSAPISLRNSLCLSRGRPRWSSILRRVSQLEVATKCLAMLSGEIAITVRSGRVC